MAEHTKTPWHVNHDRPEDETSQLSISNGDARIIANVVTRKSTHGFDGGSANAACIVKAVNNHDALVNALRNARNYIDSVIVNTPDKKKRRNFGECLRIIEAALEPVGGASFDAPQPRADVGSVGSSGK